MEQELMKSATEIVKVIPRVEPGLVSIRPTDFQGIIPHEFEMIRLNIMRDGIRVEDSASRPFLDAGGTWTGCPHIEKRNLEDETVVPSEFQNSLIPESPDITRGRGHETSSK